MPPITTNSDLAVEDFVNHSIGEMKKITIAIKDNKKLEACLDFVNNSISYLVTTLSDDPVKEYFSKLESAIKCYNKAVV